MALTPVFDLAARALRAQEIVLQTAGQNISNSSRPSYSRQTVEFITDPGQNLGGVLLGTGVRVDRVRQIVEPLVETQLFNAKSADAEAQAIREEISRIEGLFDAFGGSGIGDSLDSFFAAADDVALSPQGIAERATFLARAETLAIRIRDRAAQLATLQRQVDERVAQDVSRINGFLSEIAVLNGQIFRAELGNQSANDLRDERREGITDLAKLFSVTRLEIGRQTTVIGPDGLPLVQADRVTPFVADTTTAPTLTGIDGRTLTRVGFAVASGDFVPFTGVGQGELGGLLQVRDTDIPQILTGLDTLSGELRTAVNAVHAAGEDLDGNVGGAFFGGTNAATFSVLITDARDVAASAANSPNTPEDNTNARALAALAETPLDGTSASFGNADLSGSTFLGYYSTIVSALGTLSESATDRAEATNALASEIERRRSAISGVNVNEELLSLLNAQRSFQAAATLIATATKTLDAILEMVG